VDTRSFPGLLCQIAALVILFALPSAAEPTRRAADLPPVPELVTLELSLLGGDAVTLTVREGRLATFAHEELGYRIGIIPHVLDRAAGTVELELVEVKGRGAAATIERRLDVLRGQEGFRTVTAAAAALPLDVRVIGIAPRVDLQRTTCARSLTSELVVASPDEENPDAMRIGIHTPGCCIYCGGYETCGCSVSTPCGTCNDPNC
jgi:hypothetical protein